jgi:BirA family transcriptional regulator, biotin operon repressor / biotin---[acetyl-CoA-carboxylase] ligase
MTAVRVGAFAASLGHRVEYLDSTGSTNTEAMVQAKTGERGPLWIVAGEQTQGRGRLNRQWSSPQGNLYASLLLTDPCSVERAPQLGFVAGVALVEAARGRVGARESLGLKWPNDLLCDGAKLSGMLLEATRLPSGLFATVIGIGVNCRSHPEIAAYPTTDLDAIRQGAGDPSGVFELLSDALARALVLWSRGEGFPAIRERWLAACVGRGGPIRIALGARTIEGVFDTIDQHGRLVVLTVGGPVSIDAGDVLFGPVQAPDNKRE